MEEQDRQEFGRYLRELRLCKRLSLRDVEAEARIKASHLSQIERGEKNPPRPDVLRHLSALYNEPVSRLFDAAGLKAETAVVNEAKYKQVVENAYQYVLSVEDYAQGNHLDDSGLTLEAKRFIVEMYGRFAKQDLLAVLKTEEAQQENRITISTRIFPAGLTSHSSLQEAEKRPETQSQDLTHR